MSKDTRYYWNGDCWVPSATSVLPQPDLTRWGANCAVDYILNENIEGFVDSEIEYDDPIDDFHDAESYERKFWAKKSQCWQVARTAFEREGKQARGFGTFIHAMCESVLTKGGFKIPAKFTIDDDPPWELEVPQELTKKFKLQFECWIADHNIKVIAMEKEILMPYYGGRLDLVCEVDGVVTIIDFKTGKDSYYDNWKWQLAGYRQGYNAQVTQDAIMAKGKTEGYLCQEQRNAALYDPTNKIQSSVILKFNKKTGKLNHKCFDEYQATRPIMNKPRKANGKLHTEKYTRTYEMDRLTFNNLVKQWWLTHRGIEI